MSGQLIDLTSSAGLQVTLNPGTGELRFASNVRRAPPTARSLADLRPVLRDPSAEGPDPVSHLYRAVRNAEDEQLKTARLRYDLTVILPGTVGGEYVKTIGHYHAQGAEGVSFSEVYEVVYGTAAFLLQDVDDVAAAYPRVDNVWVQVSQAGDRIVIPARCGHVTMNIGTGPLVVSNLISQRSEHLYGSFNARHGAAYYLVADPSAADRLRLAPNPAYPELATPAIGHGSRCAPSLQRDQPLYTHSRNHPADFAFLDQPG